MSIRAMNWAMATRTDGVSAQCVLYIVADTANENGVSVHADPDYIAQRTRQSRATVFRRLKELEAAGALTRFKRYRDDGAPMYEIRLHLDNAIDYDTPPADDGNPQDIEAESQIETHPKSQIETPKVSPVRQAESHSCDSKSPSKNPEDSPPTPQRGDSGPDGDQDKEDGHTAQPVEGWEEFKTIFESDGVPILRVSIAKNLFSAVAVGAERALLIKAARGLIAQRTRDKKPGAKPSAQTFIREIEAWPGYAKLAPAETIPPTFISESSGDYAALRVLASIINEPPPTCRVHPDQPEAGFWRKYPVPLDLLGIATLDDKPFDRWVNAEKGTHEFAAWAERIERWTGRRPEPQRVLTGGEHEFEWNGKKTMVKNFIMGLRVPTPFPPRKDGSLSGPDPPVQGE